MNRIKRIKKPRKINNTTTIIIFLVFSIILSCGTYMAGLLLENYLILFLGIIIAGIAWFCWYDKIDLNNKK